MTRPLLFTALAVLALLLSPASKWVILGLGVLTFIAMAFAKALPQLPEDER